MNGKQIVGWIANKVDGICYQISKDKTDWLIVIFTILLLGCIIALIVGVIAFALLWPLAAAWAINYLFGTHIPITFTTWLAFIVILWIFNMFTGGSFIRITRK